jgi:hypothetical protein
MSSQRRNAASSRAWQAPALTPLPVRATANRAAAAYIDTFTIGERAPWGSSIRAPSAPKAGPGLLPCETGPTHRPRVGGRVWEAPAVTALSIRLATAVPGPLR